MPRKVWVYDPHRGGVKIPPAVRERTAERIETHARAKYAGKFTRLGIRFHGALCYIDAFTEPEEPTAADLRERVRLARRTWSAIGVSRCISAGSAISETRTPGASHTTPIATNGMSRACSIMERSTARPRKPSTPARFICWIGSDRPTAASSWR